MPGGRQIILKGTNSDGEEIASIRVLEHDLDGMCEYIVELGVEKGNAVGLHSRYVRADGLNLLGVIRLALEGLDPEDLKMEPGDHSGTACAPNLARRFDRALREVQAWARELRDHGPALRGGQPVEHGDDPGGEAVCSEDR